MLKLFLYSRKENIPDSFLLNLFLCQDEVYGPLFQKVPVSPFKQFVEFVSDPKEAHYMLVPHTYVTLKRQAPEYLKKAESFAEEHKLCTIIFAYGDDHGGISFSNSLILRTAQFRENVAENEVIIPAFVEDLGAQYGLEAIEKSDEPIVGFVGMTHLPTFKAEMKYQAKLFLDLVREILEIAPQSHREGLYFRRRVLSLLEGSSVCELRAQKRRSYSGARATISGDPVVIREEFVNSIKNSHLPLVVRGTGNYSLRFFEVLSLGRVPLFIDTDTPLPLEKEIDYDSIMLRVHYSELSQLEKKIELFWKSTSEQKFIEMQKNARLIFETKLRADAFYGQLFKKLEESVV